MSVGKQSGCECEEMQMQADNETRGRVWGDREAATDEGGRDINGGVRGIVSARVVTQW